MTSTKTDNIVQEGPPWPSPNEDQDLRVPSPPCIQRKSFPWRDRVEVEGIDEFPSANESEKIDSTAILVWTAGGPDQEAITWNGRSVFIQVLCHMLQCLASENAELRLFLLRSSHLCLLRIASHFNHPNNASLMDLLPCESLWTTAPPSYRPTLSMGYTEDHRPWSFMPFTTTQTDLTVVPRNDTRIARASHGGVVKAEGGTVSEEIKLMLHSEPMWTHKAPVLTRVNPQTSVLGSISSTLKSSFDIMFHLVNATIHNYSGKSEITMLIYIPNFIENNHQVDCVIPVKLLRDTFKIYSVGRTTFTMDTRVSSEHPLRLWRSFPCGVPGESRYGIRIVCTEANSIPLPDSDPFLFPPRLSSAHDPDEASGQFELRQVLEVLNNPETALCIPFCTSSGINVGHLTFELSSSSPINSIVDLSSTTALKSFPPSPSNSSPFPSSSNNDEMRETCLSGDSPSYLESTPVKESSPLPVPSTQSLHLKPIVYHSVTQMHPHPPPNAQIRKRDEWFFKLNNITIPMNEKPAHRRTRTRKRVENYLESVFCVPTKREEYSLEL
eukprot:GHVH01004512.1.p1 GENE.GHVH01004512.1~~GHVH01004512.1.p1  ORF type:complete len:554 (+),score=46.60 GHVH01004512.1:1891-3552(+)